MEGTTVLVTGASRGVGAAAAREFADAGAYVVICARPGDDALDDVAADVEAAGGAVTAQAADVRDEFDVERLAETASRAGPETGIDVVVANAAVSHGSPDVSPLVRESYAAFDDHLRTNVRGVFAAVREAAPHMPVDGRVLVVSCRVARDPTPGYGSYAVSKAAAEAVARQCAAEVDQAVGVVDPGRVATGHLGEDGRDPAEAAAFLRWTADDADPGALDGGVLQFEDWKRDG